MRLQWLDSPVRSSVPCLWIILDIYSKREKMVALVVLSSKQDGDDTWPESC